MSESNERYTYHDPYDCPCNCSTYYSLDDILEVVDEAYHEDIKKLVKGEVFMTDCGMINISRD